MLKCLIALLLVQGLLCNEQLHLTEEEIAEEVAQKVIYYGSTVRFQNLQTRYHLHSHEVKYGQGSQQQSVTGFQNDNDYNSYWTLKEEHGADMKTYNQPIKCGEIIRIEHMLTKKNLHSHSIKSGLTGEQEVSAYGANGEGDVADNWKVECENFEDGFPLHGQAVIALKHVQTGRYLRTVKSAVYNAKNCGRQCPIEGQLEVSAVSSKSNSETKWKITGGLFYEAKKYDQDWMSEPEPCEGESDSDCNKNTVDEDGYEEIKFKE